ncbi:hypothetical protein [Halorhabdus sp. CUG00001]|uniref:hypothetical protein n=1 Tax=Halorhabdus sp. CUG00001 TaxID=2600297 RepID=UPI00131CACE6|nr:hypothetical protein [Halorhabdus sp. CUG00001]
MTLFDWASDSVAAVRERGLIDGGKQSATEFYQGLFRQVGRRWNYGRYIYEYDWDLLIVLDACRADLMAEVVEEYDFLTDQAAYSSASSSGEWHRKNFTDAYADKMARTGLVSANPYTDMHVDESDFQLLDEVWQTEFDEELGTIPADRVVDHTIEAHREVNPDRLVAHFMQPHYPFVPDSAINVGDGMALGYDHTPWDTIWDALKHGEVDRDKVWDGYTDNLRYVLDHVETLLENVDAERVVITADHGNLLGEWGLYAHPQYVPIRSLKHVPWVVTSATDSGEHITVTSDTGQVAVDDQLEALGYK